MNTKREWFWRGNTLRERTPEIKSWEGKIVNIDDEKRPGYKENRALIQAAPEMLDVLEVLAKQEDWEGDDVRPDSPIGRAWAVIAEAKGD